MKDIQDEAYEEYKNMVEGGEREKKWNDRMDYDEMFFKTQVGMLNSISEAFGQEPVFRTDEEAWGDDTITPEEMEERREMRRDAMREAQSEAEYERNLDHAKDNQI